MKIFYKIYRIYSEETQNFVDYNPEDFDQHFRVKSRLKNEKAFTKTPANSVVEYIKLPKNFTTLTISIPISGGAAEEYLDISIKPIFLSENGTPAAKMIIVRDGGYAPIMHKVLLKDYSDCSYRFIENKRKSTEDLQL